MGIKTVINSFFNPPALYCAGLVIFAGIMFVPSCRRLFAAKAVGVLLALAIPLAYVLARLEPDFHQAAANADYPPALFLLWAVAMSFWIFLRMALENDQRKSLGLTVREAEETALWTSWPHLLYREIIAAIIVLTALIVCALLLPSPVSTPADPAFAPNPAKSAWYFLGLQELLVYFDPWFAGVMLPFLAVTGLMFIPFLDRNPKGAGYYTFNERPRALRVFFFAWLFVWIAPLFIGTFLRGPHWNFFGPFEPWDINKMVTLTNLNFSAWLFRDLFHTALPGNWLFREGPGLMFLAFYFIGLPILLSQTKARELRQVLGHWRYYLLMIYIMILFLVPMKMIFRWLFNLKYLLFLPEFNLNL